MARILSDEDVEAIAQRIVQLVAKRLTEPAPLRDPPPPAPTPKAEKPLPPKLAFTLKELSAELGVSQASVYRLEERGLLKSLGYLRKKIYTRREVERFLEEGLTRLR